MIGEAPREFRNTAALEFAKILLKSGSVDFISGTRTEWIAEQSVELANRLTVELFPKSFANNGASPNISAVKFS